MTDATGIIDQAPLQDRDLLQRLSLYFDALDHRLRQGEGWFIFNAPGVRANRIAAFIRHRMTDYALTVTSCMMPWRDFALSAYVKEIELPDLAPNMFSPENSRARREYELAVQVTHNTYELVAHTDLLVLIGLKPNSWHEAMFLDQTIEARYRQRRATILLTPEMPQQLEAEFQLLDPSRVFWSRLFERMYETSLVAL